MASTLRQAVVPQIALLAASGEDAPAYLQSQVTNDLLRLAPGEGAPCLWLDRKGRVKAGCALLRLGEERFLLVAPGIDSADLAEIATGNIIADEVDVEPPEVDGSPQLEVWWSETGEGPTAPEPPSLAQPVGHPGAICWTGCHGPYRWLWLLRGTLADLPHLPEVPLPNADPSEWAAFERWRIERGIPLPHAEAPAGILPQEVGLHHAWISHTKGCYLGQEVMARLHAQGQVQRKLFIARGRGPRPSYGDALTIEGKQVATILSNVPTEYGWAGLLCVKRRWQDNTQLCGTWSTSGLEDEVQLESTCND